MPRVMMVLITLFVASPLSELRAGQERGLHDLPVLTVSMPNELSSEVPK
jgi:hypothetical protein